MCVYVSVQYMCSPSRQDVSSLGNNLSRCFVFRPPQTDKLFLGLPCQIIRVGRSV